MSHLVLFEEKQVRRVWNEADQKWYFAVQDVIEILTGSADVKQYVTKLRSRDPELSANWGTICTLVEMTAAVAATCKEYLQVRTEGCWRIGRKATIRKYRIVRSEGGRLKAEGSETVTACHAFKMTAADGKQRMMQAAP